MKSISSIDALTHELVKADIAVDPLPDAASFDQLAFVAGNILLQKLGRQYPHYTTIDLEPGEDASPSIAHKLDPITSHTTPVAFGAVFVQPTRPPNDFFVRGEHANFLSVVRGENDLLYFLEAAVYVEASRRGEPEVLRARKWVSPQVGVTYREDFLERLFDHFLRPRMHRRSLDAGVQLGPPSVKRAS